MTVTKWVLMTGLCAGTTIGCFHHTYTVGSGGNVEGDAKYSAWESHWLFGIIGGPEIDLKTVCPSGNATIKDEISFLNGLVGAFIGIVWYPSSVDIYCAEGKAAKITLTPAELRAIAARPAVQAWAHTVSEAKAIELENAVRSYRETRSDVAATPARARL